jgi:hypothetical protein
MGSIRMAYVRDGRRVRSVRGFDHLEQNGVKQALEKMGSQSPCPVVPVNSWDSE